MQGRVGAPAVGLPNWCYSVQITGMDAGRQRRIWPGKDVCLMITPDSARGRPSPASGPEGPSPRLAEEDGPLVSGRPSPDRPVAAAGPTPPIATPPIRRAAQAAEEVIHGVG